MARVARKRKTVRPQWERGYKAHGYWLGKKKLGSIRLNAEGVPEEKYRWLAGTHCGTCATLVEAKRAVEEAVLLGTSQLGLFEEAAAATDAV